MRLALWPRTELTVRVIETLADGGRWRAAELAERIGTSPAFTAHLVGPLVRQGWVRSTPGPTGGHELVADAEDISVLALIEAVEGPTSDGRCVMADRACPTPDSCPLHDAWMRARDVLVDELRTIPLGRLFDDKEYER
jgi:Rrf2 family protein